MRVGIVGCGHMAQAMIARWLEAGTLTPVDLSACTAHEASASAVRRTLGIACGTDLAPVVAAAELVLLAFKPQQLGTILPQVAAVARPGQVWLSVLAGVDTARLESGLSEAATVVRCMPNTPVRLGLGDVAMAPGRHATAATLASVRRLLAPLGQVLELPEDKMDAFTAVAGCGPAYVFLFLEALAQAAEAAGLPPASTAGLARQVANGALALAAADPRSPAELRVEVTSKGGMTEAALAELAAAGWQAALVRAVGAAVLRGKALAASES